MSVAKSENGREWLGQHAIPGISAPLLRLTRKRGGAGVYRAQIIAMPPFTWIVWPVT
jgi:hypothetical protein